MLGQQYKRDLAPTPAPRTAAGDAGEAHLLTQILAGDTDAFEALYRRYFPRLARFLERMTRNTALVEEVINDTMLVVWRRSDSYDGSCKLSTWIFGIAYRTALKGLRQGDQPVESDPDQEPGDAGYEPEVAWGHQRLRQQIGAALDDLPFEQRMVVTLTYYHGMGYEEIGAIMLCPVNTVKTRMFHARRRLKILLADHAGPSS